MKSVIASFIILAALILSQPAPAATISGNFCSTAKLYPQNEPAGVVPTYSWVDLTSPNGYFESGTVYGGSGSSGSNVLKYGDGSAAPSSFSVTWGTSAGGTQNSNDFVDRPTFPNTIGAEIDDGHDQLMAGYLQAPRSSSVPPQITLEAVNVPSAFTSLPGGYSVILYFDGDLSVANATGGHVEFAIWDKSGTPVRLARVYGRDTSDGEGENFSELPLITRQYVRITSTDDLNPTAGNYVRFDGLTTSRFYVQMDGTMNGSPAGGHGVALNGFKIIPEPATIAGVLLLGLPAILRRRRR